jgi:hypothetical protein
MIHSEVSAVLIAAEFNNHIAQIQTLQYAHALNVIFTGLLLDRLTTWEI